MTRALATDTLGLFSFGRLDGDVMLSNDAGHWALLPPDDAASFFAGELGPDHPRHPELVERGFLRAGFDVEALAARVRRRTAPVFQGTHLHILVVTLRCDHACRYCHAARLPLDAADADMTIETARQAIAIAFQSPSRTLTFEFQGGEPLANAEVVRFVIEHARELNRSYQKELNFSLVTNLTCMEESFLDWLVAPDIGVCTSLDGPQDLHDDNRHLLGGRSAFAVVVGWLDRFRRAYADRGFDSGLFHVEALMTATRASLGRARDIVETYQELGIPALHLRSLNRYGFAAAAWSRIGYTPDEYLGFYFEALDAVISSNQQGADLREQTAAVYLTKLLTPDDPGHLDIRSPCGAGIGQLAYDLDGQIYTCDEGRMLARGGDRAFAIGRVAEDKWSQLMRHPTVRATAVASWLDTLPGCRDCVYRPFCGVCPVEAWSTGGDLFGQRPLSPSCRIQRGQIEGLVRRLRDAQGGSVERIFRRWTISRPRGNPPSCST